MKWLKRFRTWMRVVLPNEKMTLTLAATWCVGNCVFLYLSFLLGRDGVKPPDEAIVAINCMMAAFYGFHRSLFHPILRPSYRRWLAHQPWTPEKQLPWGPVFLVLQDLFVVGLFALPVLYVGQKVEIVLIAFLLPLIVVWTALNWFTQRDTFVYLVILILPSVLLYLTSTITVLMVVAVSAVIAGWGVRQGFNLFPWEAESLSPGLRKDWAQKLAEQPLNLTRIVGWPSKYMLDESQWIGISYSHAAAISVVLTWWALIASLLIQRHTKPFEFDPIMQTIGFGIGPLLLMLRIGKYLSGDGSPITLLGRVANFRLIIPGYDYILLIPLLIGVFGSIGHEFLHNVLGVPYQYAVPVSFGLFTWAALALPPTRREWYLTGHFRMTPFRRNTQRFETL